MRLMMQRPDDKRRERPHQDEVRWLQEEERQRQEEAQRLQDEECQQ